MIRVTVFAVLSFTAVAVADTFDAIEAAHNSGTSMATVLSPEGAKQWEKGFPDGDRGHVWIRRASWSEKDPRFGAARWYAEQGDQRQYGWLILKKSPEGADWLFTERGPSPINAALAGQAGDSASTIAGLSMGAVEANPLMAPLGGPGIAALKIGLTLGVQRFAGTRRCVGFSAAAGPMGAGAMAWNAAVLGGLGPVGLVPAVAVGAAAHKWGEPPIWRCVPKDLRQVAGSWGRRSDK